MRKTDQVRRPRASAKAATPPARGRRTGRDAGGKHDAPYHHGALREALLQAAERVLERDGLAGLTLRAVAREAGVSHAAPTHHFGDLTGLISELAAIGFRQFGTAMAVASDAASSPWEALLARPRAYVAYAQAHPGMYGLMFRSERLDYSRPTLHEAAERCFAGLADAVGATRGQDHTGSETLSLEHAAAIARAWSLLHGFTTLLLDGRIKDILNRLPEDTTAEALLDAMLKTGLARAPAHPPG